MAPRGKNRKYSSPVLKRRKSYYSDDEDGDIESEEEINGVIKPLVDMPNQNHQKVKIKNQKEHDFTRDVTMSKAVTFVGFFRLFNYLSTSAVIGVLVATVSDTILKHSCHGFHQI